jgi:hypothetical protein
MYLERRTRNKLNPDTTRKKLKHIAASAGRNKSLGFRGLPGKLHEPERVTDEGTREEVYRYLVRLRLEKLFLSTSRGWSTGDGPATFFAINGG